MFMGLHLWHAQLDAQAGMRKRPQKHAVLESIHCLRRTFIEKKLDEDTFWLETFEAWRPHRIKIMKND